ncbi:Crp/Fnr family transcriptional regulator [Paenibacillus naphthalenovorans]|uniref:Crp/Fnr family transcriptional regulator n=1 Tax=Paenibacillus naphthalenovorans TaxID=162209 RepID=UPI003D2C3736
MNKGCSIAHLAVAAGQRVRKRQPEGFRSLAITHQELSALTGTSRVMVTRVLNDWRARGIVELRKRTLCVMDLPALERIAAFDIE